MKRLFFQPKWHNLRTLEPLSCKFGLDRGTPIDRIYINDFLEGNKHHIKGITCEIADKTYTDRFGNGVIKAEVLSFEKSNGVTIIGDLCKSETLPKNKFDCFILTQTLSFIYDFNQAIKGIYFSLNDNGVALVTVPGISQISRYDMDKWGDYWRFTDLSIKKLFIDVFGEKNVEVIAYGNVLTATSFLHGISAEELTKEEIFHVDNNFQVTITIRACKNEKHNKKNN